MKRLKFFLSIREDPKSKTKFFPMDHPNSSIPSVGVGGTGTTYDVSELVGMGYTHRDAQLAMQVAHGDLPQAISFLLMGDSSRLGFCYQPSARELVMQGDSGAGSATGSGAAVSSMDAAPAAATAAAARRHDNNHLNSIGETDDDGNEAVQSLVQMGYTVQDSKHALEKCSGDVYEAIEYLLVNRSDRKLPPGNDEAFSEESDRKLPASGDAKMPARGPHHSSVPNQSNLKPPPPGSAPIPAPDRKAEPTHFATDTIDINDEDAAFAFALQQQEEENQKLVEQEAERERLKKQQQLQQAQLHQGNYIQDARPNSVDDDVAFAMALQEQEKIDQVHQLQDQQRMQAHMLLMAHTGGAHGGLIPHQQDLHSPPPQAQKHASTGGMYPEDHRPHQLQEQQRVRSWGDTPSGQEQPQQITPGRLPPPPVLLQMQQVRQMQQLSRQYDEQDIEHELMASNQIEDNPPSHQLHNSNQQLSNSPPQHSSYLPNQPPPPPQNPPGSGGRQYRPKTAPANAEPPGQEFDMFNELGTVAVPGQLSASPKTSKGGRKAREKSPKRPSSTNGDRSGSSGLGLGKKLTSAVGAVGGSAVKGAAKVAGVAGQVAGKGATRVAGAGVAAVAGVGAAAVAVAGVATAGSVANVNPNTPRMVVATSSLLTVPVPEGAQATAGVFCAVVAAAKFLNGGKVNADFLNSIMHEGVFFCAEALREQNPEQQTHGHPTNAGSPREIRPDEWSVLRVLVRYGGQLGVAAAEMEENPKQGVFLEKELNHPWGIRKLLAKCRNEQKGRDWQILILETGSIRSRDCVCVCLPPKGTMNKFWCLDMKPRACFRAPLGAYARAHTNMMQLVESLEGILKSMLSEGMEDRRKHPKQFYAFGVGEHPDGDHEPFSLYTLRKV